MTHSQEERHAVTVGTQPLPQALERAASTVHASTAVWSPRLGHQDDSAEAGGGMRVLQIPAIPLDRMWGHGPVPPLEGALELLHEQAAWAAWSKVTWFARPTHGSKEASAWGPREAPSLCG